jgi:crossover junction endodeoxyribonuclease RuvC
MPQHPQTILGIDPGFGRMGFGLIRVEGMAARLIDYGVITTKSTDTFDERLVQIAEDIRAILKEHKPDLIGIEKLFFGKSSTTAMHVSEVRGVVRLLCAEQGVPIVEFTPAQIKKTTTGDGKATKQGMQKMVQHLLGLKQIPRPDDAADALAIALTAVGRRF